MKPLFAATKQMIVQIWQDAMLFAMVIAPILMGLMFRLGVPALEGYLCARLGKTAILSPYYTIFDLLLICMTPVMFSFSGVMVVLGEQDSGISRALGVTPLGRGGYLLSRIGIPAVLSVLWCIAVTLLFHLTPLSLLAITLLALVSALLGVSVSLMVAALAKNKVEGMALTKLSGLMLLGVPAAIWVPAPAQYAAGLLPSLWMTKAITEHALLWLLPAFFTALLWCILFYRRFSHKLLG
ncbi:MAG: ABC transporter permease [Clostridia bacterium]|nr:ABC transporter permease [Clostridia bacterium]